MTPGEIEAPVVFAGFGQVNPADQIDDYDGIDVKGRFVLVFTGQRPGKNAPTKAAAKTRRPLAARAGLGADARPSERPSSEVRSG